MKLALCLIVKGTKEEAKVLDRCLHYASPIVDKIFVTATYKKGEAVAQQVWDACNNYKAVTSKFEWVNDFAAARNFNFSQVPKEFDYIFWLDADDVIRNGEKLRKVIELHPDVDVFSLFYQYAFDQRNNPVVTHHKTRVIKNDGCVEWAGELHEDFKENRSLTRFHIDGIDVLHLSNESRFDSAKERNLEVALSQRDKHPNDPRSYWNVGNAAYALRKFDVSLEAFDKFLEMTRSDDEKYLVRLRRSEVFWAQGLFDKAVDEARYAIGTKPEYPDAYHSCGKLYFQLGMYEQAKEMFLNGLGRPIPYYKIIVFNAREYDYVPLMNLAQAYYALNLPQLALPAMEAALKIVPDDEDLKNTVKILKKEAKEGEKIVALAAKLVKIKSKKKLKAELDKVPKKYQFHPHILRIKNTNFIKETSSGKDLVVFCGHTEEEWTSETILKKGSGGSEEAIVTMAQGLAEKGWNVTVYNNCGTEESVHNNVHYKPYMSWNYRDKQDVVVLWRNTKPLDWEINSPKIYVDMHDVIPKGEFTQPRISRLTKVFFKSKYHRELFPQIPDDKTVVIPNGIHPDQFIKTDKDPKLMINTASPVRALNALISMMKLVRKEIPDAQLYWAYGWTVTDKGMKNEKPYLEWKNKVIEGMKESGIVDLGRLTHKEIAELYLRASLYVYPTGFPEIDCISLTKAQASNCYPISTDYAALGEKQKYGGEFFHWQEKDFGWYDMAIDDEKLIKQFADKVIYYLKHPIPQTKAKEVLENFAWNKIIDSWDRELCA